MVDVALSVGRLLLAFVLVFANGFFVAAEFAFVRIRSTAVEQFVAEGRPGSGPLSEAMDNLDSYLAVTQLGITLASLGLGWVGEPAVAALIEPIFANIAPGAPVHFISLVLGFSFVTFLHVVFGELAPKTISIARAERVSLLVAPPMKVCYYLFMPGIVVFNGTANFFTRLIGIPPASESEETLTEQEILSVLSHAGREGNIDAEEVEMIERIFALDDLTVREVMVPRPDTVTVPADLSLDELVSVITDAGHTRYPVLADEGEQVAGFVDAKDVLREVGQDGDRSLVAADLARDIPIVPEATQLDDVLRRFQAERIQMIAVIDEWGAFEGVVTVEDVVERIVGDLWDAFDVTEPDPQIADQPDGSYVVAGGVPLASLNEAIGTDFESAAYGTIGGIVMDELGRVPEVGDRVTLDGFTIEVTSVDDARIETMTVEEGSGPDGAMDASEDDADEPE